MTGVLVQIAATSRWIKSARLRQAVGLEFSVVPPEAFSRQSSATCRSSGSDET